MSAFVVLTARLVLASTWLLAGVAKLHQKEASIQSISQFGLLPTSWLMRIGKILPWLELTFGVLLLAGIELHDVALGSACLLALFCLAIVANLLRGRKIQCNCFGHVGRSPISWWTVGRNLALIAASVLIFVNPVHYYSVDALRHKTALPFGEPPLVNSVPVFLALTACFAVWQMTASLWPVLKAIAHAEEGPAMDTTERIYLRRWLRLDLNAVVTKEER